MKKIITVLFTIIFALTSCNNTSNNITSDDSDNLNLIEYANNFKIYNYKSGHKIIIDNSSKEKVFYLFNDSISVPDELKNEVVIKTPIKAAVAFSSTQWSVFQMIGEISKVKGILEGNYSRNSEILTLVKNGTIEKIVYNETPIDADEVEW